MPIKALIREIAHAFGYDIIKHVEMPSNPFPVLDLLIDARVAGGARPYVVQIGANDGVRGDPVRHLIRRHALPGLLVEPLPDLFAALQANYAGCVDLEFERCAVGDRDGEVPLYRVRPDPSLPDWLQGLASLDRNHLTSAKFEFDQFEQYVETVSVPMLTMRSLLQKHDVKHVGLLQIDTEGFDCRIVESTIRSDLRPAIINYEHNHVHAREQAACKRLLAASGYDFVDVGIDTIAVRRDADPAPVR